MSNKLAGSDLTRAMLERGDEKVWCAVSNNSDEHAMSTVDKADYSSLMNIISFDNGCFFCKTKNSWQYAVPVKKTKITQNEVGL